MRPDASRRVPNRSRRLESDLEVCVIDRRGEVNGMIFTCHSSGRDWVDAVTKKLAEIDPTHRRIWNDGG